MEADRIIENTAIHQWHTYSHLEIALKRHTHRAVHWCVSLGYTLCGEISGDLMYRKLLFPWSSHYP